jgi:hypothetical protein
MFCHTVLLKPVPVIRCKHSVDQSAHVDQQFINNWPMNMMADMTKAQPYISGPVTHEHV